MIKKPLSFALALVIVLGIFTFPAFAAATLSLDKTNYAQGETITVSYSGITAEMKTAQAWIGIAKQGATAYGYMTDIWKCVTVGSGAVQLKAPSESGTYEARFYQGNAANVTNLVKSATVTFTVGKPIDYNGGTTQPPSGDYRLVSMWRSIQPSAGHAVYIFNADGSFAIIMAHQNAFTWHTLVNACKGNYSLHGNTLELFDAIVFEKSTANLHSADSLQWIEDYEKIIGIIKTGSKNEVLNLMNPKHLLFDTIEYSSQWWDTSDKSFDVQIMNGILNITWDIAWTLKEVK